MYYAMHQYLAQQGYVILTPDARRSSGYGRDWATWQLHGRGRRGTLDVASGADYSKTLAYVDPDRIGVWGLSYGGFLTLQAVTVTPTLFRCAIDVSGVTDWEIYSATLRAAAGAMPAWARPPTIPTVTTGRHPSGTLDALVRPLLILHGTNDTNVAFRESLC